MIFSQDIRKLNASECAKIILPSLIKVLSKCHGSKIKIKAGCFSCDQMLTSESSVDNLHSDHHQWPALRTNISSSGKGMKFSKHLFIKC